MLLMLKNIRDQKTSLKGTQQQNIYQIYIYISKQQNIF